MPQKCLHNFVLMVVPKIWWNIFCPNSKKSGFGMILASLFKLSDDTDWSSRLSRYLFIVSKPSACRIWGYNPTRSSVTNNVLSGISRSWFNRDKKSLVSSKICGIVGIIVFPFLYSVFIIQWNYHALNKIIILYIYIYTYDI